MVAGAPGAPGAPDQVPLTGLDSGQIQLQSSPTRSLRQPDQLGQPDGLRRLGWVGRAIGHTVTECCTE